MRRFVTAVSRRVLSDGRVSCLTRLPNLMLAWGMVSEPTLFVRTSHLP